MKQFQHEVSTESKNSDNYLLKSLQNYYKGVKSERQLDLEVPAGFHLQKTIQQKFRDSISSCNTSSPTKRVSS